MPGHMSRVRGGVPWGSSAPLPEMVPGRGQVRWLALPHRRKMEQSEQDPLFFPTPVCARWEGATTMTGAGDLERW